MKKKKILVLYHKNCFDGFGGAFAAWKKFGEHAEYIGVNPETLPEEFPIGRELYAIDVTYPIEIQRELRAKNASLVILDHHTGMRDSTAHFPENVFSNDHSGSVIAWKYFHPKKQIPKLLLYIEDIDLWKWKRAHTREIISALSLLDYEFSEWENFLKKIEDAKKGKEIIKNGILLSRYEKKIIERLLESAYAVSLNGICSLCVNAPILSSEIANELLKKMPPLGIVWAQKGEFIKVSLRSDGSVDVSELAKKYGGGGHTKAAGFTFSAHENFPWKVL